MRRRFGWLAAGALAVLAITLSPAADPSGATPMARLLGPFAELASDVQWIRFQRALLRGDEARALQHAESALLLAPTRPEGWELLAGHLGFFLASAEREPDLDRRRAWFRAALEVTHTGARQARRPAELHFVRGLLFRTKAELDPEIWPAGRGALWTEAAEAFRQAHDAGRTDAELLRRHALERAADQ